MYNSCQVDYKRCDQCNSYQFNATCADADGYSADIDATDAVPVSLEY